MTRAMRFLVQGAGALLIVALIAAPVWDSWRYRGIRSSLSSRIPLAIILPPSRGRAPTLASIAGGPLESSSESDRHGAGSRPRLSQVGQEITSRFPPASNPSAGGEAASVASTRRDSARLRPSEGGATSSSRDAFAALTTVQGAPERSFKQVVRSSGAESDGRDAETKKPKPRSENGTADGPSGDPQTAVLVGAPPVRTDSRVAAPTPPPPNPPPPRRASNLPSTPGDPQVPALQDPEVSLLASSSTLSVGDSLTVTVMVKGGDHVTSLPFHLMFDPAVLEFSDGAVDASLGSRLQPVLLASVSPNRPGDLAVGLSFIESAGSFTGNSGVVILHFRAIGSGDCNLEFDRASLRGATSQPLGAAFHNAAITVR
jgi:hypothetical protein